MTLLRYLMLMRFNPVVVAILSGLIIDLKMA